MSKRIAFLKEYLKDVSEGKRKAYSDYSETYGENGECLRGWVRKFRSKYPNKKEWLPGIPIEPTWSETVESALGTIDVGVSPGKFPDKYEGVKPRRAWEQRTKDGEIVTLHSYEFDSELSDLQKFQEDIIEKVRVLITNENVIPVKLPVVKDNPTKYALHIYTTDKHAGSLLRSPLFDKKYDNAEFETRLQETLKAIALVHGFIGEIHTINFVDLGDGIDGVGGMTTRGGHGLDQYLEDADQFDLYVSAHKTLFDAIHKMGVTQNLKYTVACNDNHGGFGMYVAARALQEYLNVKFPDLETFVTRDFLFHQAYGLHRFIYTHGKDDRYRKRPFPMRIDADTEKFISEYIDYHGLGKHLQYSQERACIHVIKGDLHSSTEEYAKRFRYKNIMSMFGASSWIQHNFGAGYKGFEFEIVAHDTPLVMSAKNFYF
jgi:hypothetical protein